MTVRTYNLADLEAACQQGTAIVLGTAEQTMHTLNFHTKVEVLKFIATGGLESPQFIRSEPWRNNPNPNVTIMVDSYNFHSGPTTYGYLAFMQGPTSKWLIKSFKRNEKQDPKPHSMFEALKKAGLLNDK